MKLRGYHSFTLYYFYTFSLLTIPPCSATLPSSQKKSTKISQKIWPPTSMARFDMEDMQNIFLRPPFCVPRTKLRGRGAVPTKSGRGVRDALSTSPPATSTKPSCKRDSNSPNSDHHTSPPSSPPTLISIKFETNTDLSTSCS